MQTPTNANEVIPRLWQGGKPKPGRYDFDLIVLAADEYQPPDGAFPGAQVLRVPLPDDWRFLTPAQHTERYARAVTAAETIADAYRRGQRILVTCGAGLNRSGLINGLVLRNLGYSGDDAIAAIQRARGPHALAGKAFQAFIRRYQPGGKVDAVVESKPSSPTRVFVGAGAVAITTIAIALGIRRLRLRQGVPS